MAQASKQNTQQRDRERSVAGQDTIDTGALWAQALLLPQDPDPRGILKRLGIEPETDVEFEVMLVRRDSEEVIVLKPRKKAAPAAQPKLSPYRCLAALRSASSAAASSSGDASSSRISPFQRLNAAATFSKLLARL